jgi:cbb3-type cytochrome oxidase subunit 1
MPRLKAYADKIFNTDALITAAYSLRHGPVADWMTTVNAVMSPIRVAVEWSIGRISNLFKFTSYRQKLQESAVIQVYVVSAFLTNCRTALYGAQESLYFDIEPPTLAEYLAQ